MPKKHTPKKVSNFFRTEALEDKKLSTDIKDYDQEESDAQV